MLPTNTDLWVKDLIQLDQVQAIMEMSPAEEPLPKP
jgi:hypothetical protein